MKKIGIHGSYYVRNFGDTLILYIINKWIEEHSSSINVSLPFINSDQEAFEILNKKNIKTDIQQLDGLIFGPGGYFGERSGNFFKKLRWSARNYRRHIIWNDELFKNKIPYIIVGVGVGPISNKYLRKRIVKLFDNAQFISVRDVYSKEYLIKWGVSSNKIIVVPDVALTLQEDFNIVRNVKPKVALHYPTNDLIKSKKLEKFISFIEKVNNSNDVYLLEDAVGQFSNNNKDNLRSILIDKGIELPVIKYSGPADLINQLKSVDKVITSKLHVGIVGYALGKRTLSIPNHTKTMRFYEQIKREDFCISLEQINSNILYDKFIELDSIKNSDNILFENALKNKEVVFDFLKSI